MLREFVLRPRERRPCRFPEFRASGREETRHDITDKQASEIRGSQHEMRGRFDKRLEIDGWMIIRERLMGLLLHVEECSHHVAANHRLDETRIVVVVDERTQISAKERGRRACVRLKATSVAC